MFEQPERPVWLLILSGCSLYDFRTSICAVFLAFITWHHCDTCISLKTFSSIPRESLCSKKTSKKKPDNLSNIWGLPLNMSFGKKSLKKLNCLSCKYMQDMRIAYLACLLTPKVRLSSRCKTLGHKKCPGPEKLRHPVSPQMTAQNIRSIFDWDNISYISVNNYKYINFPYVGKQFLRLQSCFFLRMFL